MSDLCFFCGCWAPTVGDLCEACYLDEIQPGWRNGAHRLVSGHWQPINPGTDGAK